MLSRPPSLDQLPGPHPGWECLGTTPTRPAVPAQPELALSLQMLVAVAVAPVLSLQEILEQWEL